MNIFGLYWGAVLIALPLFMRVGPPISPRVPKDFFFAFAVIISAFLFKRKNSIPWLAPLSIALIGMAFLNQYNFTSLSVQYQFVMFSCGMFALLQISSNISSFDRRIIKNALAITCVIQSILVVVSAFGIDLYRHMVELVYGATTLDISLKDMKTVSIGLGSLQSRSLSSALIASTLPFLFNGKFKIFIPLTVAALYLADSTMAIMSIPLAMIVMAYKKFIGKNGLALLLTATLACAIYLIYTTDSGFFNGSERALAWAQSVEHYFSNFEFFGKGLGYVYDNYHLFGSERVKMRQLHNEYLEILYAFGIPGILICVYGLFSILKTSRPSLELMSFLIMCGNGFGFFNLHISSTALVFVVVTAIILRENHVKKLES